MFTRLVGESFVRNPRRKILTAAALVVGMAVATATLTVALEVGDRQDGPRTRYREGRHQSRMCPASTTSTCPVTQPDSSEARNETAGAMSAGSP